MIDAFNRAFLAHLLLAIAALLMTMLTALLIGVHIHAAYCTLIFFSALLIYRLAYYGLPFKLKSLTQLDRLLEGSSAVIITVAAFYISRKQVAGLAITLLACLAYFTRFSNWKGLRAVAFVKSIWLAGVWSVATVWVPLEFSFEKNVLFLFAERFLFMLSICIIYNLRDYSHDSAAGISTMLQRIGIPLTKFFCCVLLIIDFSFVYLHHYPIYIYYALCVSIALTALLIIAARRNGHWLYYTLLIDGSMILQYLIVLMAVHNSVE